MIEVATMDVVGYATLDAGLRFIGANNSFQKIVRLHRADLIGKHVTEVLGPVPSVQTMLANALDLGVRSRITSETIVFPHWSKWEEHSYDFAIFPLSDPGAEHPSLLMRMSEALSKPEMEGVTSLLRKARGPDPVPLFSGEDSDGRTIDMYVHPSANQFSDRLVLLAVMRDGGGSTTFEVPAHMLSRLVLAHLLHVKS